MIAIVYLSHGKLQLVRHPVDHRVVAFDDSDAAFCFAVSMEVAGAQSAGTVEAPDGEPLCVLPAGTDADELMAAAMEMAA